MLNMICGQVFVPPILGMTKLLEKLVQPTLKACGTLSISLGAQNFTCVALYVVGLFVNLAQACMYMTDIYSGFNLIY